MPTTALAADGLMKVAGSLIGILLGASLVTVVSAQNGAAIDDTVQACVDNKTGETRIVSAARKKKCRSDESPLEWSVQGPPGLSGLVLKTETSGTPSGGYGLVSKTVNCPDGKLALGGGVKVTNGSGQDKDGMIMSSYPVGSPPSGWFASASTQYTTAGGRGTGDRIAVYVVCARVADIRDDD